MCLIRDANRDTDISAVPWYWLLSRSALLLSCSSGKPLIYLPGISFINICRLHLYAEFGHRGELPASQYTILRYLQGACFDSQITYYYFKDNKSLSPTIHIKPPALISGEDPRAGNLLQYSGSVR